MAFRLDSIASLARQLAFTPADARLGQLHNAEALLLDLDPARGYPLEFVVFRITGFHPKAVEPGDLLTGLALQHDLGLLIENVSDTLSLDADAEQEPVLQIEDAAARFGVTSKTIQRWRRRGLAARRFRFADGKRRVGFLLSSVERFLARQGGRAGESPTTHADPTDAWVRAARRLAAAGSSADDIVWRLSRRSGRAPMAVLHVLKRHDQLHPGEPTLSAAAEPVSEALAAKLVRLSRGGASLRSLARRARRPKATVYRLLFAERVARLAKRRVKFLDDALFHGDDAAEQIAHLLAQDALPAAATPDASRVPRDLPPYLQSLYRTPLLTPSRERSLFLAMNFARFRYAQARGRLDPAVARRREIVKLESLLAEATSLKNDLVAANLRLVVSVARKHLRPGLNLMELISDGNVTLMRAVDGFDVARGNRFSTYATLALMKGFARSVPAMQSAGRKLRSDAGLESVPDRGGDRLENVSLRDQVRDLLGRLDDRERLIVASHFGVADRMVVRGPSTVPELAESLGLSKQRVRQIERAALEKLRGGASGSCV